MVRFTRPYPGGTLPFTGGTLRVTDVHASLIAAIAAKHARRLRAEDAARVDAIAVPTTDVAPLHLEAPVPAPTSTVEP